MQTLKRFIIVKFRKVYCSSRVIYDGVCCILVSCFLGLVLSREDGSR